MEIGCAFFEAFILQRAPVNLAANGLSGPLLNVCIWRSGNTIDHVNNRSMCIALPVQYRYQGESNHSACGPDNKYNLNLNFFSDTKGLCPLSVGLSISGITNSLPPAAKRHAGRV